MQIVNKVDIWTELNGTELNTNISLHSVILDWIPTSTNIYSIEHQKFRIAVDSEYSKQKAPFFRFDWLIFLDLFAHLYLLPHFLQALSRFWNKRNVIT